MVYDCFTFFNELDLLEIRLNVLDSVVDRFVLVEAPYTMTGAAKPLFFEENKARFARFSDRIIHIVASPPPRELAGHGADRFGNSWCREIWQRAEIGRGIADCRDDDVIMVSDVDEIPRPEAVLKAGRMSGIVALEMRNYWYYLDLLSSERPYGVIRVVRKGDMSDALARKMMEGELRHRMPDAFWEMPTAAKLRWVEPDATIGNAAFHFTSLGGVDRVAAKLASISEQNFGAAKHTRGELARRMCEGLDVHGRGMVAYPVLTLAGYPKYIRDHAREYPQLFYPGSCTRKWKLRARYLSFRTLAILAYPIRALFGHARIIKTVKGWIAG